MRAFSPITSPRIRPEFRQLFGLVLLVGLLASITARAAADGSFQSITDLETRADFESAIPRLHMDFHGAARREANLTEARLRPSLGIRLNDWAILHAGYAWARDFYDQGGSRIEHRFFQRFTARFASYRAELFADARLDARFVKGMPGVGFALSLYARASMRLARSDLHLLVEDRAIFQLHNSRAGHSRGVEENRLFAGLGYSIGTSTVLRFGYMNRLLSDRSYRMGHGIFVGPRMAFRTGR